MRFCCSCNSQMFDKTVLHWLRFFVCSGSSSVIQISRDLTSSCIGYSWTTPSRLWCDTKNTELCYRRNWVEGSTCRVGTIEPSFHTVRQVLQSIRQHTWYCYYLLGIYVVPLKTSQRHTNVTENDVLAYIVCWCELGVPLFAGVEIWWALLSWCLDGLLYKCSCYITVCCITWHCRSCLSLDWSVVLEDFQLCY